MAAPGQRDSQTPQRRRSGQRVEPTDRAAIERKFITVLARHGNVAAAYRAAKVTRETVYRWRKESEAFATAWDEALEEAVEGLELVADQRARKQSDTLIMFLLKAHRPEKYRETTKHEHSGPRGGPIPIRFDAGVALDALAAGSSEDL